MLAMVWVRWLHTCLHNIATNSHLQKIIANIHAYIIQPKTSCCHQNKEISLFSGQNFGLMEESGIMQVSPGSVVNWEARNQVTKAVSSISLPKVMIGGTSLGQIRDTEMQVQI